MTGKRGAPKKNFTCDQIEQLMEEFDKRVPWHMAVDEGFHKAFKRLNSTDFFIADGHFTTREVLRNSDDSDEIHRLISRFANVTAERKKWYARLNAIKAKSVESLTSLEKIALDLSKLNTRDAFIQCEKALKACVDIDEQKAQTKAELKRVEARAKAIEMREKRGTSPQAERKARTARLCFYGGVLEGFSKILGENGHQDLINPLSLLRLFVGAFKDPLIKEQLQEYLAQVESDKRNNP